MWQQITYTLASLTKGKTRLCKGLVLYCCVCKLCSDFHRLHSMRIWPAARDRVSCSVVSVCVDHDVSPAKTFKEIRMLFRVLIHVHKKPMC